MLIVILAEPHLELILLRDEQTMQGFIECRFYFFPRTRGIVVLFVIVVQLPPDCFVFIEIHVGRSVDIRIFHQTLVRDTETTLKEEGGKPFKILLR